MKKLKILALNPFHGGSHKSFLENWAKRSVHEWTVISLPGTQWRWRLHFAAVELSERVKELYEKGVRWDMVFCTSMMNLAEFRGLTPFLSDLEHVIYFHENQLTYPESSNIKFSLDLCMANINSALAADRVWFNSNFHFEDFCQAAEKLLKNKPGASDGCVQKIKVKSSIHYLGINEEFFVESQREISNPLKLVWAARWEEDKNPGLFFKALRHLKKKGVPFRVSVLGEEMDTRMKCFDQAKKEFSDEIDHFGFLKDKNEYLKVLQSSDIFISTADHEFFGISAVEAVASGCIPVVPCKLSYPEILSEYREFFYKYRSSVSLAEKIIEISKGNSIFNPVCVRKYSWSKVSKLLDQNVCGN